MAQYIVSTSKNNTFNIKVTYEYPFSMNDNDLRKAVDYLIKQYNEVYTSIAPTIYIRDGEHQDGKTSTINDICILIDRGNNELSRRTNEKILKRSFVVTVVTLGVAVVSCITAIVK